MSLFSKMLDLNESTHDSFDELDSILEEFSNDPFGDIKIDKPSAEGLENSLSIDDQFVNASDGEDTDIELSMHRSSPSFYESSIEDELDSILEEMGDEPIDPMTVPVVNGEEDQYSTDEDMDVSVKGVSDAELAADEGIDESADLFGLDEDLF